MSQKFYIFRHGETFYSKRSRWYGIHTWSANILPEARPVITKLAEYVKDIPTDYHVSSEFKRCLETVGIVTDITGKHFITDRRLNEYTIETFGHFRNRVQSFLNEMNEKKYENIMICTHGAVIAGLVNLIVNGSFSPKDMREFPAPGILLIIDKGKVQQVNFRENESKRII